MPWRTLVYEQVFRPLGLCVVFVLTASCWRHWRQPKASQDRAATAWPIAAALLALALLAKICLQVRICHYGFGLSMPALLLTTVALLRLPRHAAALGGHAAIAGATVLGFMLVVAAGLLGRYDRQLQSKSATFGQAGDRFRVQNEPITGLWAQVAEWVVARTPRDATLVVMPEGVMLNYLTRRVNPTRHVNFMPPEVIMFGEDRILEDLARHPPDVIALMHRPSTEYGLPLFGKDYGSSILAWVRQHYVVAQEFGHEPLQQVDRYGAVVLRRK
jgi:hypothetical protein